MLLPLLLPVVPVVEVDRALIPAACKLDDDDAGVAEYGCSSWPALLLLTTIPPPTRLRLPPTA